MKDGYALYYEDRDHILLSLIDEFEKILGREVTDEEYIVLSDKFEADIEPFANGWRNYN